MFWGLELKANSTHQIKANPHCSTLVLSNICLTNGSLKVKLNKTIIGVLNEQTPNTKLFLKLDASKEHTLSTNGQGTVNICGYWIGHDDESEINQQINVSQLMKEAQLLKDDAHLDDVFNKAVKNIEGSLKRANWDEVDWSEMK